MLRTKKPGKPAAGAPSNSRDAAARIVGTWLRSGAFPDRMLESVLADHGFVLELVHGVVRSFRPLDFIRAQLAPRQPRAELNAYLLVGLYQLLFLDDVEDYAAVNETVSAAKAALGAKAGNMVNAVLRRAQAGEAPLRAKLRQQPAAVRLSHPDLLVERWTRQFGADRAAALCDWDNRRPELALRINLTRTTLDALRLALTGAGVDCAPHPFDPRRFLRLSHGVRLFDLPGYAEGWFSVQDPSTQIAVDLLAPQPGERVLDACAAPGGKTILAAEALKGQGTLVAMDPSSERLVPLRQNIARLQLGNIAVVRGDAARPLDLPELAVAFDAVLADVPCTNTGVIRRRPDARWRFTAERLYAVCKRQAAILDGIVVRVRPGGRLVYSTCSLEPDENEGQVETWLARHPEFKMAEARRLFPPETGTDGAYAACLTRLP